MPEQLRNFYAAEDRKRERRRLVKGIVLLILVSGLIAWLCLKKPGL